MNHGFSLGSEASNKNILAQNDDFLENNLNTLRFSAKASL